MILKYNKMVTHFLTCPLLLTQVASNFKGPLISDHFIVLSGWLGWLAISRCGGQLTNNFRRSLSQH